MDTKQLIALIVLIAIIGLVVYRAGPWSKKPNASEVICLKTSDLCSPLAEASCLSRLAGEPLASIRPRKRKADISWVPLLPDTISPQ